MKKPQLQLIVAATCVFAAFLLGFFIGRNTARTPIVLQTVSQAPSVAPAATPETVAASAAIQAVPDEPEAPSGLININTATSKQLQTLPGIGPVLAQRIIDYRTQHGPFSSVRELIRVSGIGQKRLETILDLISTEGE